MTRRIKTPRERAEEALAVAERRVARLSQQKARHDLASKALGQQIVLALERSDYLKLNPDLHEFDEPVTEGES